MKFSTAHCSRLSRVSQENAGNGRGSGKGLRTGVNAVPGSGDALASAAWAAARSGEFRTVAKDKAAVLAAGWFQDEASGQIPRDGFHDMCEMILYLPLRNAEELRKLVGGQPGSGQEPDQSLAHRL